ncbi:hypothetical protein EV146_103211 [Mesobacillus foraminis]|uniref:Uncharacterized protein n=1 Tax=Mesobacillus foraminis TaxID=279826 RepID=A0A4R2BHV8_9BACI|nr:hypothetical protein EV146_103211 [Mesobacillus foraminis]
MPLIYMKEIFTPLRMVGIKIFKSTEGQLYIKLGSRHRRHIF